MIHDFADWLSPMLVKELRQGIRSKVLISSLFILQALLILNVIAAFTAAEAGINTQSTTAFFWSILSLPLMLILPLSAIGSVGGEIKNNTLELIFLTRLNARRIVFGKWIAIVAQSLLLAVTVLPYVALRYYLGGVDMLQDLRTIGGILVASAVFTAVVIAISPFQSKILRIFLGLGLFFMVQIGGTLIAVFFFDGGRGVLRGGGLPDWILYTGVTFFVPLFVLLMLGFASSKIAPLAENHAGPRRFIGLLLLLVCALTAFLARDAKDVLILAQILLTPICLGALSENVPALSSLYRPFVKRGWLGTQMAHFFTPGWHTGFLYTLLILLILGGCWWKVGWLDFSTPSPNKYRVVSLFAFAATLLLPPALTPASAKRRWIGYLILFASSALILFLLSVIGGITNSEMYQASVILPPVGVFAPSFSDADGFGKMLLLWMSFLVLLSCILLLIKSHKPFREMRPLLAEAVRPLPNHDV